MAPLSVQKRKIRRVRDVVKSMRDFAATFDTEEVTNPSPPPPTISVGGPPTGQPLNSMVVACNDFLNTIGNQLPFARWDRAQILRENGLTAVVKPVQLFLDLYPGLSQQDHDTMEDDLDLYKSRVDEMVDIMEMESFSPGEVELKAARDSVYELYKHTDATSAINVPNPNAPPPTITVGGGFTSTPLVEFLEDVFDFAESPNQQDLAGAQALRTTGETKVDDNVQQFIDLYGGSNIQAVQDILDAYKVQIDALVAVYE